MDGVDDQKWSPDAVGNNLRGTINDNFKKLSQYKNYIYHIIISRKLITMQFENYQDSQNYPLLT